MNYIRIKRKRQVIIMYKKRILWIAQTAIFIALLVSVQAITRPFGQFVTGSCVNFLLVTSAILVGLPSAAVIAVISPIGAFLILGIPAFPIIIPFMMAGNLVLVTAIHFITGKSFDNLNLIAYLRIGTAVATGAVLKFLILWIGIVQITLPFIPDIRQAQIDAMAVVFSWPQLVTALIGSILAMTIIPILKKALKKQDKSLSHNDKNGAVQEHTQ